MGHPLKDRSFVALTISQFLGAFNDNAYRQFILLLILAMPEGLLHDQGPSIAMGLFALPFILFSLFAGSLADRYSKRRVIVVMNAVEIVAMALGMGAFALGLISEPAAIVTSMVVLFLMGAQSALFGPSKYGAIPELTDEEEISTANGIINMTTQLGIVLGVVAAGQLEHYLTGPKFYSGFFFVTVASVGWLFSLAVRKLPAADPTCKLETNILGVFPHAVREFRSISNDRDLQSAILANSWFYLIGALALPVFNEFGREILHDSRGGSFLVAALGVGIAVGSPLAAVLSNRRVELGLVPIGAVGMAVSFGAVALFTNTDWVYGGTFCAGVFGGFYIVPLSAFIQDRPAATEKGRILGLLEIFNFVFIFLSAAFYAVLQAFDITATHKMMTLGILTVGVSAALTLITPIYLKRLLLFLVSHTLYRVRAIHPENVPDQGGVLYVSNHVSYADPFLLAAAAPRLPRFLMHRQFMSVGWIRAFANWVEVIPIAETDGPRALLRSLDDAAKHIEHGDAACIFAEGSITRTGNLLPFSKGLERIAKKSGAAIVPVYLDGLWGSIFSFRGGKALKKWPGRIPYRMSVSFGKPLPPDTPTHRIRQAVAELGADALAARQRHGDTLATRFLRRTRKRGGALAVADSMGTELSARKTRIASLMLRRKLRGRVSGERHVGVLLPSSVGGALTNIALTLLGKVTVNLNFTVGDEVCRSCVEQCEIRTIVTSRKFLAKVKMAEDERYVFIEDLMTSSPFERILAIAESLTPVWLLSRILAMPRNPREDATIIFSSGSTGQPKGVRLSHQAILANTESLAHVLAPTARDRLIGVLPFFHSFGFTATIWLPLLNRFAAVYHANPTDARTIAKLLVKYQGTILISTPTFYQSYLRRFTPEDTNSLRFIASGAEKLKSSLREAWHEKFGLDIFEGYGCTELAPAVSINIGNVETDDAKQIGHKPGTIGHPLPGVATKIVNPETREELTAGEEGLLLVRGPATMTGYLGQPEATVAAFDGDWYITGDIATIDDDGFIAITGRLSRFSKIGGEMVPHIGVEETLQGILDARSDDPVEIAVTAVPSPDKGEMLVVLHTKLSISLDDVERALRDSELPRLWIPRAAAFVEVDEIPKLGTGKLDLRAVQDLANSLLPTAK